MAAWHEILIRKLKEHSRLSAADVAAIRRLPHTERAMAPREDIVRQGDRPKVSVVVLRGMVARYHTLQGGGRQYLSLHIAGDMPDAQSLFLDQMDHAVCAMDDVVVALVPHKALLTLFDERPMVGFAFWRETLIDAAIFREAISNNGARPIGARLARPFLLRAILSRAQERAHKSKRVPLTAHTNRNRRNRGSIAAHDYSRSADVAQE